jgi:class 3 adenylate cyclase
MADPRERLREFITRHEQTIVAYGTDWVIRQAVDLRGSRPRDETQRLVAAVVEFNRALLLDQPSGVSKRADFIDFVTTYRASRNFKVSTLLRGFLSFKKGLARVLDEHPVAAELALQMLEMVDELYFESIFQMSDVYVFKLRAIIEERQEQLRERDQEVAKLERQLTESLLKRFLAPSVVDEIVRGERSFEQKPRSMHVTVLFADLVAFTQLTQTLDSDRLADFLNEYLGSMSEQIFFHKGTIDKFMGDTVMALFGAPVPMPIKEQIAMSVRCAANMQRALIDLEESSSSPGRLAMRIGIDTGPVVVGSFGSEHRSDFTAMGMHVNLAHQIMERCRPGEIYVTGSVARHMPASTEPCGAFQLKGFQSRTACFRIVQSRVAL